MTLVVAVMFVVVALILVISSASTSMVNRAQDRTDNVLGKNPVDEGIRAYAEALDGGMVGEHTGFVLTRPALDEFAVGGKALVGNGALPQGLQIVDPSIPGAHRWTMRTPGIDGSPDRMWQMYALSPPDFSEGSGARVVAYFRGWAQNRAGSIVTTPEIVRVELRPGRFSDYQVIADGPIAMGAGAAISARMHSNGHPDSRLGLTTQGHAIFASAATCLAGAEFTSTRGTLNVCGPSVRSPNTGDSISMLRVKQAADRMRENCGSSAYVQVRCYTRPAANGTEYRVRITGAGLQVLNPTGGAGNVNAGGWGAAVLFDRPVRILGGTLGANRRLTIATFDSEAGGMRAAGGNAIYIHGNTGHTMTTSSSLGLMAQGDVVLEIDNSAGLGACPTSLRAAVVAAGGGVTISPQWLTLVPPSTAPRCPGPITFEASLAGHFSPAMVMTWSNAQQAGYTAGRNYRYSPHLKDNPPPFYPVTGPWQVWKYNDANYDCFGANGHLNNGPGCR